MPDGSEKKFERFSIRVSKKTKRIITEVTARHNALGGNQMTQTDTVNELLMEAMAARGLLRRDKESH